MDNGFPIKNWFEDKKDRELFNISPIMEFLAYVHDVRDFIKRMTENNDISYPKAINILNSYKISKQNLNKSNENFYQASKIASTPSIKNIRDYSYKILKDDMADSNSLNNSHNIKRIPVNTSQIIPQEERNITRYSTNLISQREKSQINDNSNSNTNRYDSTQKNIINSYDAQASKDNYKKEIDKQNINIKIINNHINNYIVNPNEKKTKQINTFRNSNTNQGNSNVEKSTNNQNIISRSNANLDQLKSNNQQVVNKGHSIKNLNINLEPTSANILKNSQIASSGLNKSINPQQRNHNVKYSSLIDNKSHNSNNCHYSNSTSNVVRPSSAIILKGKHSRDHSVNLNKHDGVYSPLNRTPSTKIFLNAKTGGSNKSASEFNQYDSMVNSRETPRRLGADQLNPNRVSQGSKSVRSSSHNDRGRYSYNQELNQWKPARYDYDDSVTARGYYFSSKASDSKNKYTTNPLQSTNYPSKFIVN